MKYDSSVLAAIIAGVSTLIVGLMSLISSRKDAGAPSQKEIYESALNNVWVPLDKLLSYSPILNPENALMHIEELILENYKLIPSEIIKEVSRIKLKQDIRESDLAKLSKISASYFNWIRKSLGYPFDKKKILIEYSPKSRRDIFLTILGNGLLLISLSCITMMLLFSILMLYQNDRLSGSDYIAFAGTLLGVVAAWYLTFIHPKK